MLTCTFCVVIQIVINRDFNREFLSSDGRIWQVDRQEERLETLMLFSATPSPLSFEIPTTRSIQVVIESGTLTFLISLPPESVVVSNQSQVSGKNWRTLCTSARLPEEAVTGATVRVVVAASVVVGAWTAIPPFCISAPSITPFRRQTQCLEYLAQEAAALLRLILFAGGNFIVVMTTTPAFLNTSAAPRVVVVG